MCRYGNDDTTRTRTASFAGHNSSRELTEILLVVYGHVHTRTPKYVPLSLDDEKTCTEKKRPNQNAFRILWKASSIFRFLIILHSCVALSVLLSEREKQPTHERER